ncbi:hypothetical protein [Mucilaginibacter sp. FT3.2]|uniref:hypothetical protein n=1 Tax=Mucilaginibacter sp. FT3.2 TaxID=2723090 RepID=UPI00161F0101|nr:hypothetical protein [Mucilaginibacter sp. FT3.2]MBB6235229.1 hypothetical protein [Mucilaginibacter sp. FT3.2]
MIVKRILFIALALLSLTVNQQVKADEPNLRHIRSLLVVCMNSSKTTDSLYKSLAAIKNRTGVISGYLATLSACKAKLSWNPYMKVKHLNNAEATYKTAVSADPHNIEIRFLRFSVEHNVPGFLGFNKDLTTDSEEIITQLDKKNYGTADKDLTVAIIKFLLQSKRCTATQNQDLNKHLAELK